MTELHIRIEELEGLKDRVQAMGMAMAKAVSEWNLNHKP